MYLQIIPIRTKKNTFLARVSNEIFLIFGAQCMSHWFHPKLTKSEKNQKMVRKNIKNDIF
jgi:glutamine amidotransferase PdxT